MLHAIGFSGVDQADPKRLTSKENCNTCVQPLPPPAILLEVVDLYDPIKIGDTTTYKITVTNQGKETVNHINVTAWVPYETKFYGASGPKIRVLKSLTAPAPNKLPLNTQIDGKHFQCETILGGMLKNGYEPCCGWRSGASLLKSQGLRRPSLNTRCTMP